MDPECSSGYISGAAVLGLKRGSDATTFPGTNTSTKSEEC